MRVAALYDIHGNLPALEAVLEDVRRTEVDRVVVGGDVVPGPMPRQTVSALLGLDVPTEFIRGNGEREALALRAGTSASAVPEAFRESVLWAGRDLSEDQARVLSGWPQTLRLGIPGLGDVLFCHATPRSDAEIFTRLTPEDRLLSSFGAVGAAVVICGHTHMQFDRSVGTLRVVNAGSVGMPFGEAGAYWLLLGPDVELRCTTYDLRAAAERIRGTEYPLAADFARDNVLRPPSEAHMVELFERAALR